MTSRRRAAAQGGAGVPAELEIDVDGAASRALVYRAAGADAAIVLAHGAGGHQRHPWMVEMAHALVARGADVVTFDFLYRHAGRRFPDRAEILERTWGAVLARIREDEGLGRGRIFIGGKSMGGRIATQVAAKGAAGPIAGLVLLGYPLHPPGKKEPLRAAHLGAIREAMLFVQGSRDAFGTPDELRPFILGVEGVRAELYGIDGADHGLTAQRAKGSTRATEASLVDRIADEVRRFMTRVAP